MGTSAGADQLRSSKGPENRYTSPLDKGSKITLPGVIVLLMHSIQILVPRLFVKQPLDYLGRKVDRERWTHLPAACTGAVCHGAHPVLAADWSAMQSTISAAEGSSKI